MLTFYLLMLIPAAILVAGSATERDELSIVGLGVAIFIIYFFSPMAPLTWIMANPIATILIFATYFLVGAIWAYLKFGFWISGQKDLIASTYNDWQIAQQRGGNTTATAEDFKASSVNKWSAANNKKRIMDWMVWWVASAFWTATHDLFRNIWTWVYARMSKAFDGIASRGIDKAIK